MREKVLHSGRRERRYFQGRRKLVFCFKVLRIFSIFFRMGNFSTFCREEKKLTEKEIGEVIAIHLFLLVYDFCDKSYIYKINLLLQENVCKAYMWLGESLWKTRSKSWPHRNGNLSCFCLRCIILLACVLGK